MANACLFICCSKRQLGVFLESYPLLCLHFPFIDYLFQTDVLFRFTLRYRGALALQFARGGPPLRQTLLTLQYFSHTSPKAMVSSYGYEKLGRSDNLPTYEIRHYRAASSVTRAVFLAGGIALIGSTCLCNADCAAASDLSGGWANPLCRTGFSPSGERPCHCEACLAR
ncbi:MAG: hypothetical protein JWQ07_5083 [Ramlibacter sp.]|nr:hypothetical protein [Ramlibacter sp.]